jgi:hypothetical protein
MPGRVAYSPDLAYGDSIPVGLLRGGDLPKEKH